jgi:hypothetical protein
MNGAIPPFLCMPSWKVQGNSTFYSNGQTKNINKTGNIGIKVTLRRVRVTIVFVEKQ